MRFLLFMIMGFGLMAASVRAQVQKHQVVDQIVAVVGEEIVLRSYLEIQAQEMSAMLQRFDPKTRDCEVLRDNIRQKMMLGKAAEDSIEVSEDQVNATVDRRMEYFIQRFGSERRLEKFADQSIGEIREEMRPLIRDQLLIQQVEQKILGEVHTSPAEVRAYFKSVPKDSLPLLNTQVQVRQVLRYPKPTEEARQAAIQRLRNLRTRILQGESFETLAILYSADDGSAARGGEVGYQSRANLAPEYAAAAFKLDRDSLSDVVETKFGMHLIQLLDRRGESVNTRHILIKPELNALSRKNARELLDSVRSLILYDTLSFHEAARIYSEDEQSKNNGGLITSPESNSTTIEVDNLDAALFLTIDTMEVGNITPPVPSKSEDGRTTYRIVRLEKRIEPHRANLRQDYPLLKRAAEQARKQEHLNRWMADRSGKIYLQIQPAYHRCRNLQTLIRAQRASTELGQR